MFLLARRNFLERILTIFSPLSHISPDVAFSSRLIQRINVLFPAPDGPMSAITWPFSTLRSTPFMARSPVWYFLTSCFISSIDIYHAEARSVPTEKSGCGYSIGTDEEIIYKRMKHRLLCRSYGSQPNVFCR